LFFCTGDTIAISIFVNASNRYLQLEGLELNSKKKILFAVLAWGLAGAALAQGVRVEAPWTRATQAEQTRAGVFMRLTAPQGAVLVGASSPAARVTEIHEIRSERGAMEMRAIPSLDLPAGKPVDLYQCGHHLMLVGLKQPLVRNSTVPVTLVLKDRSGAESRVDVQVPVTGPTRAVSLMDREGQGSGKLAMTGGVGPDASCSVNVMQAVS
jgi:periplasmic copper chaperone A